MQSVGAAWLMISLNAGPMYVALIQTASALPFFIFALPAGAIGDIVDRRRLILYTETWMLAVAITVALLTISGWVTPLLLLILTFAPQPAMHLRPLLGVPSYPKLYPKKIFRLPRH
jgi:MFS family permease